MPGFLGHDPTLQRYRLTSVAVYVTKSKNERQEPDVLAGRMDGWENIDLAGVGDPACDLPVAWNLLPESVRDDFRVSVLVD